MIHSILGLPFIRKTHVFAKEPELIVLTLFCGEPLERGIFPRKYYYSAEFCKGYFPNLFNIIRSGYLFVFIYAESLSNQLSGIQRILAFAICRYGNLLSFRRKREKVKRQTPFARKKGKLANLLLQRRR